MIVRVPEGKDEVSAILDAPAGPILSNDGAMAAAAAPPAARVRNVRRESGLESEFVMGFSLGMAVLSDVCAV
jgi:hypothetical protein